MTKTLNTMTKGVPSWLLLFMTGTILLIAGCRQAMPVPTNGTIIKTDMEESGKKNKRDAWIERMHSAAPGTNWKKAELENAMKRQQQVIDHPARSDAYVDIADGKLTGTWQERGSDNQAGSVMASAFDEQTGTIYTIAAGGSLFKGNRYNERWAVVNEQFVFDGIILEIFHYKGTKRMLASSGGVPMFSDDMGLTWQVSKGVAADDSYARSFNVVMIGDSDPYIYMLTKSSYWNPISVYRTTNGGESFHPIRPLGNSDTDKFWLTSPPGTEDLYLFDRIDSTRTDLYRYAVNVNVFWPIETTTQLTFSETPTMVVSSLVDSTTHFYAYATGDTVKVSSDTGRTWVSRGVIPEHPWNRRFFVFDSDPRHMLAGGVELYASHDGGLTWDKLNNWWEYYDDVPNKIHADMMYFREFADPAHEDHFTLISNHGGMSISTNYGVTTQNIGMEGLNVSQYYSVRTDPLVPAFVYAGSQDQGFQRGLLVDESSPDNFDQLISGDYGHIVFSDLGRRLWTVYPDGSVSYYHNPRTDPGPRAWFELDSENESVWIPPLAESPFSDLNEVYMAGGNIDGGPGSHLIRLTYASFSIQAEQMPYDFRQENLGELSAIAFSPMDPSIIYTGTTSGGFFVSMDGGQNWTSRGYVGPGAQYLYGNDIYASSQVPGMVLFAGSGYSNPPVWISFDHGQTFTPMSDGLPPTLVFQVAANADESAFFAATEAGPYVFFPDEQLWYPMSNGGSPSTRYWSVEYLPAQDKVRFGTYGRGIWDFQVQEVTAADEVSTPDAGMRVFPNPTFGRLHISLDGDELPRTCNVSILDASGTPVFSKIDHHTTEEIDIGNAPAGIYILRCAVNGQVRNLKIVKQ